MVEVIRDAIRKRGPVPFTWFMEQALYHSEHGYYSSGRSTIGRSGDYYTNVSVGPLFGRLMAAQFGEMWEALGRADELAIVEQGAHGGEYAQDVLEATEREHPDFFGSLRYVIIEPYPVVQERQKTRLKGFAAKVAWYSSLEELPPFRGLHFSNELLDAMPVHLVRWTGEEWTERHVTDVGGDLAFVDLPVSADGLAERLRSVPLPLPSGYETEVNVAALQWIEALASKLTQGFILAVDYGWPRDEFYAAHRTTGTLQCYAKHRVVSSPLLQVGDTDITAHVEWTSLVEQAQARGLRLCGFTDQHHFITGLLAGNPDRDFATSNDPKTTRALQTLLHPSQLGMKFQYLVLSKGLEAGTTLSGLSYARDSHASLDLR